MGVTTDEIVITGVSGKFPDSENVNVFKENLMSGANMIRLIRPALNEGDLPYYCGKIKDYSKFDANFFGVHPRLADCMEPQIRILLETVYEAIVDAGVNPTEIRGQRIGVFVACSGNEGFLFWQRNKEDLNSYLAIGNPLNMVANRVSYSFDFTGPSFVMDTACSGSGFALHEAVMAMERGECDAAIVAATNSSYHDWDNMRLSALKLTSPDGSCKSFDAAANGYVRSETIAAVFLQRRYQANRIYASILKTESNCDGYKEEGITYPKGKLQRIICEKAYAAAGVHPDEVAYIEAHGSGTQAGDYEETTWIANYFGEHRKNPLLIGSTKSNVGHTEAASGIASLIKVLIAMESGVIPANLHYKNPNPRITGLLDGRLKVVDTNTKWNGGIVGINNFGFGGVNVHVILKSFEKEKTPPIQDGLPRLVCISGRTESAVNKILSKLETMPRDDDLIALFHKIHRTPIANHPTRGFTVLEGESAMKEISDFKKGEQVWYVLSGMGAQWVGMGRSLMALKPFRETMERCAEALKPAGFDLFGVIDNDDVKNLDYMANCATCITAIQVALIDVLTLIGVKPDGVVGHSMGEIACGYADGTLTAEQCVLVSFWRGRCVDEDKSSPGAMAAVGLTWEEAKELCAGTNASAVCHNAANSVTISGPAPDVDKLVEKLVSAGKFARKVQSSGQALHTKYISQAGKKLLPILKKLIPSPNPRTKKWISSSVPEDQWNSEAARYSSAEYLTNNLLQPVLFYEAVKQIPENSVVIEIGPHALFQGVLKKIVPASCTIAGLQKSGVADGLGFLLSGIGKLFIAGLDMDLSQLYPPVSMPVARTTPMISPMIEWDHSVEWTVPKFDDTTGDHIYMVDVKEEDESYLLGHQMDGRVVLPASKLLTLVWQSLAKVKRKGFLELPVAFENVTFLRPTIISEHAPVKVVVKLLEDTDEFQVICNGVLVCTGNIRVIESLKKEGTPNLEIPARPPVKCVEALNGMTHIQMTRRDFYAAVAKRAFEYHGQFQSIKESDNTTSNSIIEWTGNWVTFLDGLLQITILRNTSKTFALPTRITKLIIDPIAHLEAVKGRSEIEVQNYLDLGPMVCSGGCEVKTVKDTTVPRRPERNAPQLESEEFVPFFTVNLTLDKAILRFICIAQENFLTPSVLKITELTGNRNFQHLFSNFIVKEFEKVLLTLPKIDVIADDPSLVQEGLDSIGVKAVKGDVTAGPFDESKSRHVVVGFELISRLKKIAPALMDGGFVITREAKSTTKDTIEGFNVISEIKVDGDYLILLRLASTPPPAKIIKITKDTFNWVETLKAAQSEASNSKQRVVLIGEDSPTTGLLGLFLCLGKEPNCESFQCVVNFDGHPISSAELDKQLSKNLRVNVMKNGKWGGMQHFELSKETTGPVGNAYVNTLTRGDLSSLRWFEGSAMSKTEPNTELCTIYYSPLNFKDIMLASGKLPADALPGDQPDYECILGLEFAGRNSKGERVMGCTDAKAMATDAIVGKANMWKIPDNWTMEQASSVPIAYATAIYALLVRGGMRRGDSVLIHTGSGGVGLAAIHLALHMDAEVFTTVGSEAKKEFLLKRFPKLDSRNIGNSRDTSFEQLVLSRTNRRGVDLVLNSLADDKLQASVRCVAVGGHFLEIGKFDLAHNSKIGMAFFLKNISFHGVLLDSLFADEGRRDDWQVIGKYMTELIENGAIQPLPVTLFESTDLEEAFRYMSRGKHVGKVVIKVRNDDGTAVKATPPVSIISQRRIYFNPNKSYVLCGGLGGLGIELCHFMLKRGARNIVLVSTRGVSDGYQLYRLREWYEKGFKNVLPYKMAFVTQEEVTKLLDTAAKMAPIAGIFNLAGVLRDGPFENQTVKNFEDVAKPKIELTELLDKGSRKRNLKLDHFVVYSSVSCGRGNPAQTNYGYANSRMERLCELRQKDGLPATAIQWGPISGTGMVESLASLDGLAIQGITTQSLRSYVETLDVLLLNKSPILSSTAPAQKKTVVSSSSSDAVTLVANIIGIKNPKGVAPSSSLIDLGMDSLMAAEIRLTLERESDVLLTIKEIKELTFGRLIEMEKKK